MGTDITKFHSSGAFSNWLHLCPNEKITGGKVISSRTKRGTNPLSKALKNAANVIGNLKTGHLANFFKRIAYRGGRKEAITATAHKLAVIIYNMLTKFEAYKPYCNERTEKRERQRKLKDIGRLIKKYQIGAEEVCFS